MNSCGNHSWATPTWRASSRSASGMSSRRRTRSESVAFVTMPHIIARGAKDGHFRWAGLTDAPRRGLTSVRWNVHLTVMKTVPISELRQRVADVIGDVQASDEPTVVVQRSRPAAYIVSPKRYER